MKKPVILLFSTAILVIVSMLTITKTANSLPLLYGGGPPAGYSDDPAGGNISCTNCHSGPAAAVEEGWITSDVPITGYRPDSTYTITATATRAGHAKFGFQISPQNASGTFLGTLDNINTDTKLTSNPNYITHTSEGNAGENSRTWTFSWTAPSVNSGIVNFYGAFLATDNSGTSSADTTYLSVLSVDERSTVGINEKYQDSGISIYPNPFSYTSRVETKQDMEDAELLLYNSTGQIVREIRDISGRAIQLNREDLPAGQYFINILENNKVLYTNQLMIVD